MKIKLDRHEPKRTIRIPIDGVLKAPRLVGKISTTLHRCPHGETLGDFEECATCHLDFLAWKHYGAGQNGGTKAEWMNVKTGKIQPKQTSKENIKMAIKIKTDADTSTKVHPAGKTKSASSTDGEGRRVAHSEGKSGRGVNQTWVYLFETNEERKHKWTDEDISELLKKEFPKRKSKVFNAVSTVRSRYNRGVLTGGKKPKIQSSPYNKEEKAKK